MLRGDLPGFPTDTWFNFSNEASNFPTTASPILILRARLIHRQPRTSNLHQDLVVRVANKQTQTFGELLTLGTIVAPSTHYTGPVDVILGEHDLVFCGGDCTKPQDQSALVAPVFYPAAKSSQHHIIPGAGHVIFADYSAQKAFDQMTAFIKANGL